MQLWYMCSVTCSYFISATFKLNKLIDVLVFLLFINVSVNRNQETGLCDNEYVLFNGHTFI